MAPSAEYGSYVFQVNFAATLVGTITVAAFGAAVVLRVFRMTQITNSLFNACVHMKRAGKVLKMECLDRTTLCTIALAKGGIDAKTMIDDYEKLYAKPIKLLGNVFGCDEITTDFVKYYDSSLIAAEKTSKKTK
ncbi:unnamed protein product [Caenorhabditis sp. 36 PRJEB53466]|nr:unnamed protein product [Caenorhabditis sp. 36 PRJEB53466]